MPEAAIAPPVKRLTDGVRLLYLDFVIVGIVMTLLGPLLPALSTRWGLNDTRAGYLFAAQFAASLCGMLLSSVLVERLGYRVTLIVSVLTMAAGVFGLARANWMFGLLSVCVFGFGFGINTPAGNLRTARTNPAKAASALNLLNSCWGVGAMMCPLVVAGMQRAYSGAAFLYGTAIALIGLAGCLSAVRFTEDGKVLLQEPAFTSAASGMPVKIWNQRLLPVIGGLFFIYVGTETCVGGWVASYAHRIDSHSLWAITPSFFWGALLLGRLSAPLALRHHHETKLATAGVAAACLGIMLILLAHSATLVMAGAAISGLGLASVFPINVALLPSWFGESASRVSGVIFSLGNLGGAVMPWAVGAISTQFGSLRSGFMVPFAGSALMMTFYLAHNKKNAP